HTSSDRDWSSDVCSSDLGSIRETVPSPSLVTQTDPSPTATARGALPAFTGRILARPASLPAWEIRATRSEAARPMAVGELDGRPDRKSVVEGKGEDVGGR